MAATVNQPHKHGEHWFYLDGINFGWISKVGGPTKNLVKIQLSRTIICDSAFQLNQIKHRSFQQKETRSSVTVLFPLGGSESCSQACGPPEWARGAQRQQKKNLGINKKGQAGSGPELDPVHVQGKTLCDEHDTRPVWNLREANCRGLCSLRR